MVQKNVVVPVNHMKDDFLGLIEDKLRDVFDALGKKLTKKVLFTL